MRTDRSRRRAEQLEARVSHILTVDKRAPSPSTTQRVQQRGESLLATERISSATNDALSEQTHSPFSAASRLSTFDPFAAGLLSVDDAVALLNVFKEKMEPHFPFVILPDVSVTELWHDRPILCLATLAMASFHAFPRQQALCRLFSEAIAAKLVSGAMASLDFLQGLLVYLAW